MTAATPARTPSRGRNTEGRSRLSATVSGSPARHVSHPSLLTAVDRCGRCGFCREACPVYAVTGVETTAPRGRLALIRAVLRGELQPGDRYEYLLYNCLSCKACAAICPSGVKADQVVLDARAVLTGTRPGPLVRGFLLDRLLTPRRLEGLFRLIRPLRRLAEGRTDRSPFIRRLLPSRLIRLADLEPMLPPIPQYPLRPRLPAVVPAQGKVKARVGYFLGCMQNVLFQDVVRATLHLLSAAGCEVVIPSPVYCCGVPHRTYGRLADARALARRNMRAFAATGVEAIVTDCATCGCALREYPDYWQNGTGEHRQASHFAGLVRDVHPFLLTLAWRQANFPAREGASSEHEGTPPGGKGGNERMFAASKGTIPGDEGMVLDRGENLPGNRERWQGRKLRVTYHEPCHLGRGQGVRDEPRTLLRAVPGIELVEMAEPDRCCGGAGSFALTRFDISMRILEQKVANVEATGATIVATPCPSCAMQLRLGLQRAGLPVKVVHPVQLLIDGRQTGTGRRPV